VNYRPADPADIPALGRIRAADWGKEEYWSVRIAGYASGELHPREALKPRVTYVASEGDSIVGFIAGHLTRRYGCDGELEWIDVVPDYRRCGVASELLRRLAKWFAEQGASKICVDVDPANKIARSFYSKHRAENLNPHWLVWGDITSVLRER
jgi:ribosomal protein S18 acetylase RimI-like enzyme